MAQDPGRPDAGPGGQDETGGQGGTDGTSGTHVERRSGVATKTRPKTKRPPRFKVVLYNDDYTPMEFVVALLQQVFSKPPAEATQLMLQIHHKGAGIAGVYVLEVAETKVAIVHRMAEERGHPLRAGAESE